MVMTYKYGEFSDKQINDNSKMMHSEVHKLLLYKDKNVKQEIFQSDEAFLSYFSNLLKRFGGLNELLGCPSKMVDFMSTLEAAYLMVQSKEYNFNEYRRLILDAHGFIKDMFEEMEV